ncbi:MAG: DNA topoisomerase IV subunit A [Propionibacteriaceae bacterium]|jgi:DNA gyrase subunit A|nr:DNA topoisomerase IV subunit A [Propionibacteriaceae bacterium]
MSNTVDEESERIIDVDVSAEMEASFLEYAYSVIYARALPDARDGLKPVQRRILYSMDDEGLRPDKAYVKCARVVGNVMGRLHPHGDSAIYDAMVRLGQPWAERLLLIDGHGNFGSLDAGPAAMRYTECRMASGALAMTTSLDEDTVDFRPNYDGKELEPTVLPAAFPNLLVNGATGIAVGMATNIPPHNLVEVVAALKYLLANPTANTDDLMRFVPGPDLPSGGRIVGLDGLREAYETGRGTFRMRATARIEQVNPRRKGIIITELPYLVGPERILDQIKALVQAKKLIGIADAKDLTDLDKGLQLVIEVKNGINPEALLAELYRQTKLEDSFAINAVALVEGQPRTLSLKELLQVYLDHRLEVTLRRSRYRLAKAQERLHLVEGLLIAIIDIDDVIAIVRSSDEVAQARERLIEAFDLTEAQANYILDMQLRQLTKLSRIRLEAERDELIARAAQMQAIIDSPTRLHEVVTTELTEVAERFGDARRTVLLEGSGTEVVSSAKRGGAAVSLEIPEGPAQVLLSTTGLLARIDSADPLPEAGPRDGHDVILTAIKTTSHAEFGILTDRGRLIRCRAIDLPTIPVTASAPNLKGGSPVSALVGLDDDEHPIGLTTLNPDSLGLALGTRAGVVKRVNPEVLGKSGWDVIRLEDGDRVVGAVELTNVEYELVFITSDAQLLRFPATSVRPQGRAGGGMAGIKLAPKQHVIWFGVVNPTTPGVVVSVSGTATVLPGIQAGNVKVTPFSEYPGKGRATGGVRCHRFLKGEDMLLIGWAGAEPAVASASSGAPIELPPATGKRDGSGTPTLQPIAAVASRKLG